jgi:hypothetical protein
MTTYYPDVQHTPNRENGMHPKAEDSYTVYYKGRRFMVYRSPLDPWVVCWSNIKLHQDGTLQACIEAIALGTFNMAELPPSSRRMEDN